MTDKTQPEALRLANNIHCGDSACKCSLNLAAAELLRQHARVAALEQEVAHADSLLGKANALARIRAHRIAELEARVQELGAMARENPSRRIVELEAQIEAIGAGGVSGPLMGHAAPPTAQAEGWTKPHRTITYTYPVCAASLEG